MNPKKPVHIFCITCPSEEDKGGDVDYTKTLVKILNEKNEINAKHYVVKKQIPINELAIRNIAYDITNPMSSFDPGSFKEKLKNADAINVIKSTVDTEEKLKRSELVEAIIEDLSRQKGTEKTILNLQLRFPQTGTLILPHDLAQFKRMGAQVIVTCHEYLQYDAIGFKDTQKVVDEYLKAADNVIFFNEQDRNAAIKSVGNYANALRNKSRLSAVPPTIHIPEEQLKSTQERPGNILFFGLIRDRKGFEFAIPLAQAAKNEGAGRRIIIAGNPMNGGTSIPLEYLQKVCDLPIDFRFGEGKTGLKENEFEAIFNEVKYAMVFDNFKGFSHNSSAAISLLANVPILFTNKGATTPSCLLKGGANAGSVIFIENNPSKVFECIQKIESNLENVTKIRKQADYFLKEHHSPEAIISDFAHLLNIPLRNTNTISLRPDPLEQDFYETGTKLDPEWTEVKKLNLGFEPERLQSIMNESNGNEKNLLIKAQQVLQLLELMRPTNNQKKEKERDECLPIINFCDKQIKTLINGDIEKIDAVHKHFFKELELSNINLELISNKETYGKRFNEFFMSPLKELMNNFLPHPTFNTNSELTDLREFFDLLCKRYSSVQQSSSSSSSSSTSSSSSSSSACTSTDRTKAQQVIRLAGNQTQQTVIASTQHSSSSSYGINLSGNSITATKQGNYIRKSGTINLSGNPITDTKQGNYIRKQGTINLSGNSITNIKQGNYIRNISTISLSGNSITDTKQRNHIKEGTQKNLIEMPEKLMRIDKLENVSDASEKQSIEHSLSSSSSSNFENRSLNKEVPQNNLQSNIPQNQVASGPQKRPREKGNYGAEAEARKQSKTNEILDDDPNDLLDTVDKKVDYFNEIGATKHPEYLALLDKIESTVEEALTVKTELANTSTHTSTPKPGGR